VHTRNGVRLGALRALKIPRFDGSGPRPKESHRWPAP
jgi:hypothetical protein